MKETSHIQTGDICLLVNDKKVKGSGLNRGDEFYIGATKVLPVKKSDPYLQRIYVIGFRIEGDVPQIPTSDEEDETKSFLLDPRNLQKCGKDRVKEVEEAIEKEFGQT